MASSSEPKILVWKATAAMAAFKVVKPGADNNHVAVASAATQKLIGIAQSAPTAAEDDVEVALPGGGGKALLGVGGAAWGDLLTSDASGTLVVTTSANDKVIAQAQQDGIAGDVIAVEVLSSNY